ncbi:hypothetical protein OIU78_019161 [Salix suchowensis]|uniref:Uncharacterized protein n=1 Tax=Salix koriyanagi TaxID=2511006 RepID=A0A9Q0X372_9ROSI|nr:hypothetical protein OIU78_019161 [Salix suchowensis]KAJ6777894.1 hypothetical protein OIU74_001799 [Salix koriyanagi]
MAAGVEMLKKVEERGAVKEERGGVSGGGGGNGVHELKKVMVAVRAKRRGGGEKVDAEVTFMTPADSLNNNGAIKKRKDGSRGLGDVDVVVNLKITCYLFASSLEFGEWK